MLRVPKVKKSDQIDPRLYPGCETGVFYNQMRRVPKVRLAKSDWLVEYAEFAATHNY